MIRFAGQTLFESGPSRLEIGGVSLRHASQPTLDGSGEQLAGQGQRGRTITQHGTLRADTPAALLTQRDAIEAMVDGHPHTLVDAQGQSWSNVVMLEFEVSDTSRLGPGWKLDYRINYVQVTP